MDSSKIQQNAEENDVNQSYLQQLNEPLSKKIMEQEDPFLIEQLKPKEGISIQVIDSLKRENGITPYYVYCIRGQDKNGQFDCYRRFNEFDTIRNILVQQWPGCFIAPLPNKKALGNTKDEFILQRRRYLNHFCLQIGESPYLFYSQEFQFFLRSQEQDITKSLNNFPKTSNQQKVELYKQTFPQIKGKEISADLFLSIQNVQNQLEGVKNQLQILREKSKDMIKAKNRYNNKVMSVFDSVLPIYEKDVLNEYVQGKDISLMFNNNIGLQEFSESKQQFKDNLSVNGYFYVFDMFTYELRDCEAMIEAINCKKEYEKKKIDLENKLKDLKDVSSRLNQGKKPFRSFFVKGTTEEYKQQVEQEILERNKKVTFLSVINSLSKVELIHAQQQTKIWGSLQKISNNLLE